MTPRLSQKEFLILQLLLGGKKLYGLELVNASNGQLKRGTVYVTLNRMVEKGYLEAEAEKETKHPGLPRKLYSVTGYGVRVAAANDAADAVFKGGFAVG